MSWRLRDERDRFSELAEPGAGLIADRHSPGLEIT